MESAGQRRGRIDMLQAAGVNQLNVSLDTLVPEKFEFITRRKGFSRVVGAIEAAVDAGGLRNSTIFGRSDHAGKISTA